MDDVYLPLRPTFLFRSVTEVGWGGGGLSENISLYRMTIIHSLSVRRVYGVYLMHVHTCR